MAKGRKTGGRKVGTPNKATKSLQGLAQEFTAEAVQVLVDVMRNTLSPPIARVQAADRLLDRGHGKSSIPLTGPDGGPILITWLNG